MNFEDWLSQHGLEKYKDTFAENDVDFSVARSLSESDLKELGLSLGHRKKFLEAVEALLLEPPPARKAHAAGPAQAERRQLTIMFCDLAGSTALANQIDPETLRDVMRGYQQTCRDVIEKYEGHVAQYLGDGLMVYFGWPRAHEDDAERSVRTALELVLAVGRIVAPDVATALQVRIGIATGAVVVGETGDGDASVPKLAVGETPNLAARLQALAQPGQVVIAPSTHLLLRGTFEYEDLGPQTLKGIVEPVHARRVCAVRASRGRFEAIHPDHELTQFVGRESEQALLLDRWRQACEGEGQVVLLCGEPGIGKSRMTQSLLGQIEADAPSVLSFQCSPYHRQSALFPVIEHIERSAQFERGDDVDAKLDKLETWLTLHAQPPAHDFPLMAQLLSLPVTRYPALAYSQQKQKDLLLRAIVDQFVGQARRGPLLMVLEDAHWIDPTTQETFDALVSRIAAARILLLFTYRPEYTPPWSGEAHLTTLTLNRLNARLGAALVQRVTRGKTLPREVLEQIVAKTDGIPLFVEELTKAVIESKLMRETLTAFELEGPLPPLAIPSTLHDSLMARLDRLPSPKEIAQLAACIGREFSFELLAAVSPMGKVHVAQSLEQLVQAQLVFRNGAQTATTYSFKHALIRDAAYESLLKSKRQELHANIARAVEAQALNAVVQEPAVVAHHYHEAALFEQAVSYWNLAAQRALEGFGNAEASGHVARGLEALKAMAPGPDRDRQELLLQMNLGTALGNSKGYTPPEVGEAFHRARELCDRVGLIPQMLLIQFGLWVYYVMRADYEASHLVDEQIIAIGRANHDSGAVLAGHYTSSTTQLFKGDLALADWHFEQGWALYDPAIHSDLAQRFHFDPATGLQDFSSWTLLMLGHLEKSSLRLQAALKMARGLDHPLTLATTLAHATCIDYLKGDAQSALDRSRETVATCRESGILIRQVEAEILQGWAMAQLGDTAGGLPILESAIATWNQIGAQIANPMWYTCLSRAYALAARYDDAWKTVAQAKHFMEKNREYYYEAEIHRWQGELHLMQGGNVTDAEACLQDALRVARSQGARFWELRAATALAWLWQDSGKRQEARALLTPVHDWFTEGLQHRDLVAARELLDQLAE